MCSTHSDFVLKPERINQSTEGKEAVIKISYLGFVDNLSNYLRNIIKNSTIELKARHNYISEQVQRIKNEFRNLINFVEEKEYALSTEALNCVGIVNSSENCKLFLPFHCLNKLNQLQ